MSNIFSMDNKFFNGMDKVGDLIMINILFIICSIPIFTIGASYTAMYKVALDMVKKEEGSVIRNFFEAFKDNFKKSTIVWLILSVFIAIIYFDFIIVNSMKTSVGTMLTIGLYIVIFVVLMGVSYIFPTIATFENTIRNTVKNSFLMAIGYFPYTLGMIFMNCLGVILFLSGGEAVAYVILAFLLIGYSGIAFINSMVLHNIFEKYNNIIIDNKKQKC